MSTLDWPDDAAFAPRSQSLVHVVDRNAITAPLTGKRWARTRWAKWGWQLEFSGEQFFADRARLHGFLSYVLAGGHFLRLPHFKHPEPFGTVKRTGIACLSASAFATSVVMTGGNPGGTLLAGDWFSIAGQLFRVGEDTVFDGAGFANVKFSNAVRVPLPNAASVTLSNPLGIYALTENSLQWPEDPGEAQRGFIVQVEEVI